MLMFVAVFAFFTVASAGSYGGYSGGYGGSAGFALAPIALGRISGCHGGCGGGYVRGLALSGGAIVNAAVQTRHNVEYREAPSGGVIHPTMVEVDASPIPVQLVFRSASSLLNVQQNHMGSHGSVQESQSEDEPHILRHEVTKPVIQEIREIVTPFRKIAQEIRPVQEQINTVVARGVAGLSAPNVVGGSGGFTGSIANGNGAGIAIGGGNGLVGSIANSGNSFALGGSATFGRPGGNLVGGSAEY